MRCGSDRGKIRAMFPDEGVSSVGFTPSGQKNESFRAMGDKPTRVRKRTLGPEYKYIVRALDVRWSAGAAPAGGPRRHSCRAARTRRTHPTSTPHPKVRLLTHSRTPFATTSLLY